MKKKIKKVAMREISISGFDPEKREAEFSFMTEEPCGNWNPPEICLCESENADLRRFQQGVMPLLFNHNRDAVIGKVDNVHFEDGRAIANVTFDDDEFSNGIVKKIESGSLRGVSVGYSRQHVVYVEKGEEYNGRQYDSDVYVCDKWEPFEISIVSCPADPNCAVGRELDEEIEIPVIEKKKEEKRETMTPEELKMKAEKEAKAKAEREATIKAEREASIKAERERVSAITSICEKFNVEGLRDFINNGDTVDHVREVALEQIAGRESKVKSNINVTGEDEKEKTRNKCVDGMALRYGVITDKEAVDGAREFANMNARSLMEEVAIANGESARDLRRMSTGELVEKVLGHRAMGSEQFVSIVDNFANKVMLKGYNEQPTIYRNFVSKGSVPDFKIAHSYRVGLAGEPELMAPESDEFKYTEMKDESYTRGIHTYGKAIRFTREIFINDDLGTVVKLIRAQSAGFERLHEKMFFKLLGGTGIFTKAHSNVVVTNKNISVNAYGEMRNLMRRQTDAEGKAFVGVNPKFILAGDDHAFEHAVLLHSTSNPSGTVANIYNPVNGLMQLYTSPYISGTEYYAIAYPMEMEGIEYTTLNGNDAPQSRTITPTTTLGIEYQFWQDFGFNLIDYRAFVKNDGK